jgi:hypothetical protein
VIPRSAARAEAGGRRRRRWLAVAVALAVVVALESVPDVPGHDQAALVGSLVASDATAALSEIPVFHRGGSGRPCAALESEFGVGNHLFKNNRIGWYASLWPDDQALEDLYVTSLEPDGAGCLRDFDVDVSAIDANYWDQSSGGAPPAFDQGPNPLHLPSDYPRLDDGLWTALAVMTDYSATGDRALLRRAEAVFRVTIANWSRHGGGITWEDHLTGSTDDQESVVSNAPAVPPIWPGASGSFGGWRPTSWILAPASTTTVSTATGARRTCRRSS